MKEKKERKKRNRVVYQTGCPSISLMKEKKERKKKRNCAAEIYSQDCVRHARLLFITKITVSFILNFPLLSQDCPCNQGFPIHKRCNCTEYNKETIVDNKMMGVIARKIRNI